ncbi:hypothetical protein P7C70_g1554, partial [Phenoliferia sp. Uapishka_3]
MSSDAPPQIKVKKEKRKREAKPEEPAVEEAQPAPEEEPSFDVPPPLADGEDAAAGDAEDDTPALSHKEKRLAKRRKLSGIEPPVKAATEPVLPGGPIIGNTPAKSAHGVWVGNMNFNTTSKLLLSWFEDRGLKEVTRINMPGGKRVGENNRGFAYIDFQTPTDVEIAVGLSEQHLDGRKLLIKSSSDFSGRPTVTLPTLDASALEPGATPGGPQTLNKTARRILDKQKNAAGPTLFMGNLGFETTVDEIREMFDAHQKAAEAWAPKAKGGEEGAKVEASGEDGETEKDEDRDDDDEDSENESGSEDAESAAADSGDESGIKAGKVRSKVNKGPKDLSKAKDAGIRKIRLGTFEDTGKCKGWAFIDFHMPEQCTRALLNIRNHSLNGRTLVVEYASAEAVRRGGIGTRAAINANRGGRGGAAGGRGNGRPAAMPKKNRDWDDADVISDAKSRSFEEDGGDEEKATRGEFGFRPSGGGGRGAPRGGARGGRGGGRGGKPESSVRAKPGAALASAQRASEAIVESQGRKITFD